MLILILIQLFIIEKYLVRFYKMFCNILFLTTRYLILLIIITIYDIQYIYINHTV